MGKKIDIIGKKFNLLTVVKQFSRADNGKTITWLCKCECYNYHVVRGYALTSGNTKSCGCLRHKRPSNKTHGLRGHRLYGVWQNMKNRCYNKNVRSFLNYGAKNITVCDEWKNDFRCFYTWCVENGWKEGLEIDRKKNNSSYSPSNCRVVTRIVNLTNKGKYANNTSGYTGVSYVKHMKKWGAFISECGIVKNIGHFNSPKEAVIMRNFYIVAHRLHLKVQPVN